MIYIIPLDGLTVRVPNTKAKLPAQGAWVPAENYWLRRISDGSVREAEQPKVKEEPKIIDIPKRDVRVKRNREDG